MDRRALMVVLALALGAVLFLFWQWPTVRVLRVADGKVVGFATLMDDLKGTRFIFVGESHERASDHRAQLDIIRQLHGDGIPLAIGMEMFTAGSQEILDRWVAGQSRPADFVRSYYREWPIPWPLYRDIFVYARQHSIPLIGLNIPRGISRKVARNGFAALTAGERQELPAGVTCSVDAEYRAFIRRAYAAHEESEETFEHFCEAQMLWNGVMAKHLLEYGKRHPDATIVVLAGIGHAMKGGIPQELSRSPAMSYRVILPELSHLDQAKVTDKDADYLWLAGFWEK